MVNSRQRALQWPYPRYHKFEKEIRSAAASWFEEKGFKTQSSRPYCLDTWESWPNNIIVPEVVDYIKQTKSRCEKEGRPFPLHKYVHHGLSSQAMLFNLIGPLVVSSDLEPLRVVILRHGLPWPENGASAQFEVEDRAVFNEEAGQPTSIDLVIGDIEGNHKLFIESKFVEREFGGCSVFSGGDCDGRNPIKNLSECYLQHIDRYYWKRLKDYGFTRILKDERLCILAVHYQFFRELVFALHKGGYFILLYDERSPVFYCKVNDVERGLVPLLRQYIPKKHEAKFSIITVQQVVEEIKATGGRSWISEFERKYALEA